MTWLGSCAGVTAALLLMAAAALAGCRTAAPRPAETAPGLGPALARYAEAHRTSSELRRRLDDLAAHLGSGAGGQAPSAAGADALRDLKREYFALREALFELAFLHAAAIVERSEGAHLRSLLLRVSLSLLAGTDLVNNFHAVSTLLAEAPPLRAVWDEADPARGIPAGSWDRALSLYRDARHHDLLRRALDRVGEHQHRLEAARAAGDPDHGRLFPEGVGPALADAARAHALLRARLAEEDLTADVGALRTVVERSRTARAAWAAAAPGLAAAIAAEGGAVRGPVHLRIQGIKQEYLELREGLYGLAFKHFVKITRLDIPYQPDFRLRATGISLLAAATLWENADAITTHLLAVPRVRALLNQGDPALGIRPGFWDYVEREFVRWEYRALLEQGIRALEAGEAARGPAWLAADPILGWVTRELAATSAAQEAGRDRTIHTVALMLRPYLRRLNLVEGGIVKDGRTQFSRTFGNLMGAFEFRKGKLFDQPEWVDFVRRRLEPGDLLLEKTPFRLTDKFIPGHFGHVAVYVGTVEDLRRLGLADHPWVAPHLGAVARGRVIVEALREGTQINTIERFLNIDDLAILRPKPAAIPGADVVRAVLLAFAHIGKKYDFDFDNNTWDTIVCSELAFHTYVNVPWPFAKMLGSYTISPDDVAVFAGADAARPFALAAFVHDGRVVHDPLTGMEAEDRYVGLLGRRYAEATRR